MTAILVKELLDHIQRQVIEHRKAEAKKYVKTAHERRLQILDPSNRLNSTFPWLNAAFVKELIGSDFEDDEIPPGILNVVYLYKIMEQLSTGKGFRTYLGVMRRNDLWCNIRTYSFGELKNTHELAHKEARVLALVSGDCFFDDLITSFKTLNGFYIITRHVKSTPLHNFIKAKERFNDKEMRFYIEEIVYAIDFLHQRGIIHRELSAANIKLTAEGHIKVFNLQNAYIAIDGDGQVQKEPNAVGVVGLDAYLAPELIDQKYHGYAVDWWCLGTIIYFMMTGKMPFRGNTRREVLLNIKHQDVKFDEILHEQATYDLVFAFLQKKPNRRLGYKGTKEVFDHKYFRKTYWDRVMDQLNTPPFLPATSVVTSLPSALCRSFEHLGDSEPVKKAVSRRDIEKMHSHNLAPDEFYEFELHHDWTTYVHPDMPIEDTVHYVHGELKPPMQYDDRKPLEECITSVPELSPEEKEIFIKYLDVQNNYKTPIQHLIRFDKTKFALLSPDQRKKYNENPDDFIAHLQGDDVDDDIDEALERNRRPSYAYSTDISVSHSSRSGSKSSKSIYHMLGFNSLKVPNSRQDDSASLSSFKLRVPGSNRASMKSFKSEESTLTKKIGSTLDKMKFWKSGSGQE